MRRASAAVQHRLAAKTLLATSLLAGACAPEHQPSDGAADPSALPVLSISETPSLEIGLVSGDRHYLFDQIVSVRRMAGGDVLVADGRANRISVFDAEGKWLRSWGRQGDGPGEFQWLSRVYLTPASVLALDSRGDRATRFDLQGRIQGTMSSVDLSGDSVFAMDVWPFRRFLVSGALTPEERARVKSLLSELPSPGGARPWREVRITAGGDLLIREPDAAGGMIRWTTVEGGRPRAVLALPEAFDPQEVRLRDMEVLGRWLDPNGVNFARVYALKSSDETAELPEWLAVNVDDRREDMAADTVDLAAEVRGILRQLAVAEELHYADHFTYTSRLDSLSIEIPVGLELDILNADDRGWALVATHRNLDRLCLLGYGASAPPGWPAGVVACGS